VTIIPSTDSDVSQRGDPPRLPVQLNEETHVQIRDGPAISASIPHAADRGPPDPPVSTPGSGSSNQQPAVGPATSSGWFPEGRTTPRGPPRPVAGRRAGWGRRPRPGGRPRLCGLTAPIVPAFGRRCHSQVLIEMPGTAQRRAVTLHAGGRSRRANAGPRLRSPGDPALHQEAPAPSWDGPGCRSRSSTRC